MSSNLPNLLSSPQAIMRHVEALSYRSTTLRRKPMRLGKLTARVDAVNPKSSRKLDNLSVIVEDSPQVSRPGPSYEVQLNLERDSLDKMTVTAPSPGVSESEGLGLFKSVRELTAIANTVTYMNSQALDYYEDIGMYPGERYGQIMEHMKSKGSGILSAEGYELVAYPLAMAMYVTPPYLLDRQAGKVTTRRLYLSRLFNLPVTAFPALERSREWGQVRIKARDYARDEHALNSARRTRGLEW